VDGNSIGDFSIHSMAEAWMDALTDEEHAADGVISIDFILGSWIDPGIAHSLAFVEDSGLLGNAARRRDRSVHRDENRSI